MMRIVYDIHESCKDCYYLTTSKISIEDSLTESDVLDTVVHKGCSLNFGSDDFHVICANS